MIKQLFKSVLFVVLVSPLALLAMEPHEQPRDRTEPDKIALGKQLVAAIRLNDWHQADQLIKKDADLNQQIDGFTALMWSVDKKQEELTKKLIDAGADPNIRFKYLNGLTALMFAIQNPYGEEIVRILIDGGADLNSQDPFGETALIMAIRHAQQAKAQMLICAGADLNLQNNEGITALMFAVLRTQRHEIATSLIDAGADLILQSCKDKTALMFAANHGYRRICHMLINAMLKQNMEQKDRIYTFLLCLKQIPGFRNTNQAKHLFKPILLPTLIDVRQEINRIRNTEVRIHLLEKYGFQPISNAEAQ
jgi:ankyrin repeat protein